MSMKPTKAANNLPPYSLIRAATRGDIDALEHILRHYAGYITELSTKTLSDKTGFSYSFVDSRLRHRLEIKLITKTIGFRII